MFRASSVVKEGLSVCASVAHSMYSTCLAALSCGSTTLIALLLSVLKELAVVVAAVGLCDPEISQVRPYLEIAGVGNRLKFQFSSEKRTAELDRETTLDGQCYLRK